MSWVSAASLKAEAWNTRPVPAGIPVMFPVHCLPFDALVSVVLIGGLIAGLPPLMVTEMWSMSAMTTAALWKETETFALPGAFASFLLLQPVAAIAGTGAGASIRPRVLVNAFSIWLDSSCSSGVDGWSGQTSRSRRAQKSLPRLAEGEHVLTGEAGGTIAVHGAGRVRRSSVCCGASGGDAGAAGADAALGAARRPGSMALQRDGLSACCDVGREERAQWPGRRGDGRLVAEVAGRQPAVVIADGRAAGDEPELLDDRVDVVRVADPAEDGLL